MPLPLERTWRLMCWGEGVWTLCVCLCVRDWLDTMYGKIVKSMGLQDRQMVVYVGTEPEGGWVMNFLPPVPLCPSMRCHLLSYVLSFTPPRALSPLFHLYMWSSWEPLYENIVRLIVPLYLQRALCFNVSVSATLKMIFLLSYSSFRFFRIYYFHTHCHTFRYFALMALMCVNVWKRCIPLRNAVL